MTLIELLTLLVSKSSLRHDQKLDAYELLNNLRVMNAFGTVAAQTSAECKHEPQLMQIRATKYPHQIIESYYSCRLCHRRMGSHHV